MSLRSKPRSHPHPVLSRAVRSSTPRARNDVSAERLARDPASAVSFVLHFSAQEGLPPDRLLAKLLLMRQSPAEFFLANPALFFADLNGPFSGRRELLGRPAPRMLIDGDPHLHNFGAHRGPDGHAAWGLNDFDQAGQGSPEWDLERLATSAVLAAREAKLSRDAQLSLVKAIGERYFDTVAKLAQGARRKPALLSEREASGPVRELVHKADATRRSGFLKKYVRGDCFRSNEALRPVPAEQAKRLEDALSEYARHLPEGVAAAVPLRVLDVAERLDSGGSSHGLPRYYALVAHAEPGKRPLILEVKALLPSPIDEQDGDPQRSDAAQVVENQRVLGAAVNPLTGATVIGGASYLVRELEPETAYVAPESLSSKALRTLCAQAAEVLARSHAQGQAQARAISAWVGDDAAQAIANLCAFARAYADQVSADWAELRSSTSA